MKRCVLSVFLAFVLVLCVQAGCAATDVATPLDLPTIGPTCSTCVDATPAPAGTAEPTDAPTPAPVWTPAPTDVPTAAPSEAPAATPDEAPAGTASPSPLDVPWDEETCDHANEHCQQAPRCGIPGHAHIIRDANGLDVPQCELGEWVLNRQDERYGDEEAWFTLVVDSPDTVLWRSGIYELPERSMRITVKSGRRVTLRMASTTIGSLRLEEGAELSLVLSGQNRVQRLYGAAGSTVQVLSGGALCLEEYTGEETARFLILGGSVNAQVEESEGRSCHLFRAAGIRGVTLNGEAYPADCADADGYVYLWLPEGDWSGAVAGGQLRVTGEAAPSPLPPSADDAAAPAEEPPEAPAEEPAETPPAEEPPADIAPDDAQPLQISELQTMDEADGSLTIRWVCPGAGSQGVQYMPADEGGEVPAAFAGEAVQLSSADGSVSIEGLAPGAVLSFRVYAAEGEGLQLSEETEAAFVFSEAVSVVHRAPFQTEVPLDAPYSGSAYVCPLQLEEGFAVRYSGALLTYQGLPKQVGDYVMTVHVPEGSDKWLPGDYELPLTIHGIAAGVVPQGNQYKYEGEADPPLRCDGEGLWEGDSLKGSLGRGEGEEPGAYDYELGDVSAKGYYELSLDPQDRRFLVFPRVPALDNAYTGETDLPLSQRFVRADGRAFSLEAVTAETLTLNGQDYGAVCTDADSGLPQPFTPSLVWARDSDQVLLRLKALPDRDGDGYALDENGRLHWGARTVELSWDALCQLAQQGVDAISLHCRYAALTLPLSALMSEELQQALAAEVPELSGAAVRLTLCDQPELPLSATGALMAGSWESAAVLQAGAQQLDLAACIAAYNLSQPAEAQLAPVLLSLDAEVWAALLQQLRQELYLAERFSSQLTLLEGEAPLEEVRFVVPEIGEGEQHGLLNDLMYHHRYVCTALRGSGTQVTLLVRPAPKEDGQTGNE